MLHIELLAVMEGLWLAQRLGVHQVVVESDSTQALAVINAYSGNVSALGLLAEDVWQVATALHPTQFVHVPRTCRDSAIK